jgi:hypothetical protein
MRGPNLTFRRTRTLQFVAGPALTVNRYFRWFARFSCGARTASTEGAGDDESPLLR